MRSIKEICKSIAVNNDEYIFLTSVADKISVCSNRNIITNTNFLDERQQLICTILFTTIKCSNFVLFGGYDDAVRKICFFIPDYDISFDAVSYIRVTKSKNDELFHKDYLGSLMGLNITRERIGDILVTDTGADIIVLSDILDFLLLHYNKVGRKNVVTSKITKEILNIGSDDFTIKEDTISSMRLDLVVSSAFSISRNNSKELIEKGRVLLNSFVNNKPDKIVKIGDKIGIKGMGKVVIFKAPYITRKSKIKIQIKKY